MIHSCSQLNLELEVALLNLAYLSPRPRLVQKPMRTRSGTGRLGELDRRVEGAERFARTDCSLMIGRMMFCSILSVPVEVLLSQASDIYWMKVRRPT